MLVVDDDPDTREMYRQSLRVYGFEPLTAASAEDALDIVRRSLPAAVVTDLRLKGNMDGIELARRLRDDGSTKDVRIIMLTGAGLGDERQRAEACGCDAFLLKPCLPDRLAAEILRLTVAGFSPGRQGAGNLRAGQVPTEPKPRRTDHG